MHDRTRLVATWSIAILLLSNHVRLLRSEDVPGVGWKPVALPTTKTFPPSLPLGLAEAPIIVDEKDLDKHVGRVVIIRGRICRGKIASILGVEITTGVKDTEDARNRDFCAVGILVKHEAPPKREETPERKKTAQKGDLVTVTGIANGGFRPYSLYTDFIGKHARAMEIVGETPPGKQ